MSGFEMDYIREAFRTNWLSTVGPNLDAFESAMGARLGLGALAVSSGTAAIHLGLRVLGVGAGDEVLCPSLTFAASANPVRYLGAEPVFLDSERRSWNLDPQQLELALQTADQRGNRPRAVIVVHLFGQCADMDPILEICGRFGVPVLEDAAEALGASYRGRPAGTMGDIGVFSFNGNKIITTTGGGMLVSRNREFIAKARHWSTQARDAGLSFEHSELGYNYRLSNVLAGIGLGQLSVLEERVAARQNISRNYRAALRGIAGIEPMPEAKYGVHTHWLSCFLIEEELFGISRDALIENLAQAGIEARPVWKPMHLQRLYQGAQRFGGAVAEDLHARGICLPSSSSLSAQDQAEVIGLVLESRVNANRRQDRAFAGARA